MLGLGNVDNLVFSIGLGTRSGDPEFKRLLAGFSRKEVVILGKYSDLVNEVKAIARLTPDEAITRLEKDHGLEVSSWNNATTRGPTYISVDMKDAPSWADEQDLFWCKDEEDGEFLEWAKCFLIQGLRIEILLRYLEFKKNKREKSSAVDITYL